MLSLSLDLSIFISKFDILFQSLSKQICETFANQQRFTAHYFLPKIYFFTNHELSNVRFNQRCRLRCPRAVYGVQFHHEQRRFAKVHGYFKDVFPQRATPPTEKLHRSPKIVAEETRLSSTGTAIVAGEQQHRHRHRCPNRYRHRSDKISKFYSIQYLFVVYILIHFFFMCEVL